MIKHLRWYIVALVFLATVINYVDRMAFNLTTPILSYVIVAELPGESTVEVRSNALKKLRDNKIFKSWSPAISDSTFEAMIASELDRRVANARRGVMEKASSKSKTAARDLPELVASSVNSAIEDKVKALISIIAMAFQIGYILGPTPLGLMLDRLGTRKGYPITMAIWSAAGIITVFSVRIGHGILALLPLGILPVIAGFALCRFILGFGEAGNWPAAIKSIGEWFPIKERSFAMGWFNSGSSVGAFLAPIVVGAMVVGLRWQPVFIVVGLAGFAWIALWMLIYYSPEKHPRLEKSELEYILHDRPKVPIDAPKLPVWEGLKYRQVRGVIASRFFSETVWWFCQTWLPLYFMNERGIDFKKIMVFMVLTFLASDLGNLFGGWLSSHFLKMGWSINRSRKTVMTPCGILMILALAVPYVSVYTAVAILGLVTFCYQAWSVNMQTIPADVVPNRALASTAGLAHMTAGLAGFSISLLAGKLSFTIMFTIIGCAAAMALILLFLAVGRIDPEFRPGETASGR